MQILRILLINKNSYLAVQTPFQAPNFKKEKKKKKKRKKKKKKERNYMFYILSYKYFIRIMLFSTLSYNYDDLKVKITL
jgi:hypothetical protein